MKVSRQWKVFNVTSQNLLDGKFRSCVNGQTFSCKRFLAMGSNDSVPCFKNSRAPKSQRIALIFDVFLLFHLMVVHNRLIGFSMNYFNLKPLLFGTLFKLKLFDLVPCNENLIIRECQMLLMVIYCNIQNLISPSLQPWFIPPWSKSKCLYFLGILDKFSYQFGFSIGNVVAHSFQKVVQCGIISTFNLFFLQNTDLSFLLKLLSQNFLILLNYVIRNCWI